ncbi:PAZ domain-containing protein, partial [Caulochytrium protostelioides]
MDVSSTTFYPTGSLIDVVCAFFGARNITGIRPDWLRRDRNRLVLYLKGLKTKLTYENHTKRSDYKIAALTKDGARETVQEIDGKKISIANYYLTRHNIHLEFPTLPCAVMDKKGRVIIPMELLTVKPGQRHTGKLNDKQLADMIKVTAVRPDQRLRRIEDGRRTLHGRNPMLADWGFALGDRLVEIEAHQMQPPTLTFGGGRTQESDGSWNYGRGMQFRLPCRPLACWAVAVFDRTDVRAVENFVGHLGQKLESMGVQVHNQQPPIIPAFDLPPEQVLRKCQQAALAEKRGDINYCQLVLCILDGRDKLVYKEIKAAAETVILPGLMTQCCLSRHVMANKPAYISNLILKINAKMFGVNVGLDLARELLELNEPAIIMGADVSHPPPGGNGMSIAALSASVDHTYARYRATYRRQPHVRSEMIQNLEEMAIELFALFKQSNPRYPPRKVLFYRDGVSEGQFDEVAFEEIPQLKKALAAMGWMNTKLTFIT